MVETESGSGFRTYEVTVDGYKHIYTTVNLGDGVYNLLFEEIYKDDKLVCSIDALLEEDDNYERIIIDTPSFERSIHTNKSIVTSDNIFVKPEKGYLGKVYCSNKVKDKFPLEGYLEEDLIYTSIEDEEYYPFLNTNCILIEFLEASKELKGQTKLVRVPKK